MHVIPRVWRMTCPQEVWRREQRTVWLQLQMGQDSSPTPPQLSQLIRRQHSRCDCLLWSQRLCSDGYDVVHIYMRWHFKKLRCYTDQWRLIYVVLRCEDMTEVPGFIKQGLIDLSISAISVLKSHFLWFFGMIHDVNLTEKSFKCCFTIHLPVVSTCRAACPSAGVFREPEGDGRTSDLSWNISRQSDLHHASASLRASLGEGVHVERY